MKYLLDTCVVSDFVKGDTNTLSRLKNTPPSEIAISSITVMEIEYGLALNPSMMKKIKILLNDFMEIVTVLNYNQDDASQSALVRALLKQHGTPIGSYDVLLAGMALNHKTIFVTSNTRQFERVNGLKLENWRD
jgi:tRNA(fMet)-specific endonuclease VapC